VSADLAIHPYHFDPAPDNAGAAPTLLILHGTGGNEHDLVPLARHIAPTFNLLSPRGNVLENGMPRFFRRIREGVFDQEDLRRRTDDLVRWLAAAAAHHQLDVSRLIALGYSNGANIASSILLRHSGVLAGAALLRAMVPFDEPGRAQPRAVPVLLVSGEWDPIVPIENARRLARLLQDAGARIRHEVRPTGHQLDTGDARCVQEWLSGLAG